MGPLPDVAGSFARGAREAQEARLRQLEIEARQQEIEAQALLLQHQRASQTPSSAPTISLAERDRQNAASSRQASHELVGDYLAKGQCDKALTYSLFVGDIELANQVKTYCAATTGPDRPRQ